jgi:hypothetical protein
MGEFMDLTGLVKKWWPTSLCSTSPDQQRMFILIQLGTWSVLTKHDRTYFCWEAAGGWLHAL